MKQEWLLKKGLVHRNVERFVVLVHYVLAEDSRAPGKSPVSLQGVGEDLSMAGRRQQEAVP